MISGGWRLASCPKVERVRAAWGRIRKSRPGRGCADGVALISRNWDRNREGVLEWGKGRAHVRGFEEEAEAGVPLSSGTRRICPRAFALFSRELPRAEAEACMSRARAESF